MNALQHSIIRCINIATDNRTIYIAYGYSLESTFAELKKSADTMLKDGGIRNANFIRRRLKTTRILASRETDPSVKENQLKVIAALSSTLLANLLADE